MLSSLREVARRVFASGALADAPVVPGAWYSRDEAIMGTAIHVELWSEEREAAQVAMAQVMQFMHHVDAGMSPHKPDSELSRINREATAGPVRVSAELFALLERAQQFARLSGGAFDITYASVGRLYDYREHRRPDAQTLALARAAVGYQGLELDAAASSVRFARAGICIDLGGFAKGYAVEQGAALLKACGVRHGIVTAGGDSRILGDRCGRPWTIGVRDPRRPGELVAVLPLRDVAVSTSGDYERYFDQGGVRFHHILDPRTGQSPHGVRSVTIVAPDGLTSEALSKTVFVLGVEEGLRMVQSQKDVDAVVIDANGKLHYSTGLRHQGAGSPQGGQ